MWRNGVPHPVTVIILRRQLYYGFKHSTAAYDAVMKQWSDIVTCDDVELLVGLAAYKVGQTDQYGGSGQDEWQTDHDILAHQIDDSRAYKTTGDDLLPL